MNIYVHALTALIVIDINKLRISIEKVYLSYSFCGFNIFNTFYQIQSESKTFIKLIFKILNRAYNFNIYLNIE